MRLGTRSLITIAAVGLFLANVGRIPQFALGGRMGAFTLLDLTLIPLWLLLLPTIASGRRRWRLDGVSIAGLLFVVVALVTTVLAGPRWGLSVGEHLGAAAFLVRWVLYAGFFLLIVTDPEPDEAGQMAWARIDQAIVAIAAFGVLQSALLPNFAQRLEPFTGLVFDQQGRRLASTLLDPNFAGGVIAIGLLMRLAREAEGLRPHRGVFALLAVALVLTLSRSAVLAALAGTFVIVLVRGINRPLRRLGLLAAVVALPLLPAAVMFAQQFNKLTLDGSALQRLVPWMRGGILVSDHPVLGVGFNAAVYAQRAYGWDPIGGSDVSMDGGLLFVAVMTGLLGLAAYVGMLGAFGTAARRTWRSAELPAERRAFALGGWAVTVGVLVEAMFTNALLVPWLMLPLWVLWGRVMATAPAPVPRASRKTGVRRLAPVAGMAGMAGMAALVLSVSGCDPCSGVANCSTPATRIVSGTIIDRETQEARSGVLVTIGAQETHTNAAGRWRMELPSVDDSVVTVAVQAAGVPGYTVPNVRVRTSRRRGDGEELGIWYDRPYFSYTIGIQYRGVLVPRANVRFTADPSYGDYVLDHQADGSGYVRLAGDAPRAGRVVGTLRVSHATTGTRTYPGVVIRGDHALQMETIRGNFVLDVKAAYGGNIIHRGTGEVSPGSVFRFTRSGGLGISPNPVEVTAGANGFFVIELEPLGLGEVVGNVRITPPGGGTPYTYTGVRFTTYDSTAIRYIGLWAHGERWDWVVEIRNAADSTPVTWTPFRFTRTGGLAIEPRDVVNGSTNGSGRLLIRASVRDTGTVVGTLSIRPSGLPAMDAGTLFLRTFAADSQRFAGIRYVTPP